LLLSETNYVKLQDFFIDSISILPDLLIWTLFI